MAELIGRRVYPVVRDGRQVLPTPLVGDFCCYEGEWWVVPPLSAEQKINAAVFKERLRWGTLEHEVEEHEDGTITVTPSIEGEHFHGHLRRGVWSW